MNITELRLLGFKSFVDPARAPIENGLTGVVGPNGCGKSNLLEAVRWVMGATSAKSMRASDMEDVIFAGSAGRPSREFAEVTVVLTQARGRAPAPFQNEDVLEVTRRIRRGLGSIYRINGKEMRAKDVQLLFADAATGANSPALVRQGQISELIAAKPQNRRRILEDAAGIAGLYARRHDADLKLKAAETNLTRLDEVLAEIEGQAASLKKQARQAERYRGLAQTLRETEALLLHRRWGEAREREAQAQGFLRDAERVAAQAAADASAAERAANEAREALGPLREEEMVAAAVLRRFEGVRVGLERDVAEADAVIARCDEDERRARDEAERLESLRADAQAALARLGEEAAELGSGDEAQAAAALKAAEAARDAAAAKRSDAEAKLERLASDVTARKARAQALSDAANTARSRLERLAERRRLLDAQVKALPAKDELDRRFSAAKANATKAAEDAAKHRMAVGEAEAALKHVEAAEEAAWAPYRAAETAFNALGAEMRGLEKLTPAEAGKFPPVLNAIEVEPGYERALAAALGEDIEASMSADAPLRWAGAEAPSSALPAGAAALATFVKAPEALAARLALIGVVDAKDGAKLSKKLAPGARLVSREGDLWRWDGFVRRADAPQPAAARLEHKNRLAAARAELKSAEAKLVAAKAAADKAQAERQSADAKLRALRGDAPKLAAVEAQALREAERIEAELARLSERRADLDTQAQTVSGEISEAEAAANVAVGAVSEAPAGGDDAALGAARGEV
ncbi:MAG: AAA family ATPase, partial [Phycisphaerales bacterium]|nr:AAA family ATPase [Hyphomonadaceae bacterium]